MKFFILLILLLLSVQINAEVFKCDINGTITFTDKPCDKKSSKKYFNSNVKKPKGSGKLEIPFINHSIIGKSDNSFKKYFTDNFKNSYHTTPWAKYVVGFEVDNFSRYIILDERVQSDSLLMLCIQIRTYNQNNLSASGKMLSGKLILQQSKGQVAYYSPSFDECSTISGKNRKW